MKKNIINSILSLAVIFSLASCEKVDYNAENLEGYVADKEIVDIQTIDLTITDADYATIAGLEANKEIARTNGYIVDGSTNELKDGLSALTFSDKFPASDYLPAFLDYKYSSYLSKGSKVKVTYSNAEDMPEEIMAIIGGESYKLADADYAPAWDGASNAFYTPLVSAEKNLPAALKAKYPNAVDGDCVLVTYNYASQEPGVVGGGSTGGNGGSTGGEGGSTEGEGEGSTTPEDFTINAETMGYAGQAEITGTATVGGVDFEYVNVSATDTFGTTYIQYDAESYIANTSALDGVASIVITGNGYVKTNLVVTAGDSANPTTVITSDSADGEGWGSEYVYNLPAGTKYVKFAANTESTHDAGISSVKFVYGEGSTGGNGGSTGGEGGSTEGEGEGSTGGATGVEFLLNAETMGYAGQAEATGTATLEGVNFEYVNVSATDTFGTTYIQYDAESYIANTSDLGGATSIIVTGNAYVKTNLVVTAGDSANPTTVITSDSADGSGWGAEYVYNLPAGTKYVKFSANAESEHDAGITSFKFVYGGASSAMAKAAASVATTAQNVVYTFANGAWAPMANTYMLNAADYTAMTGTTFGNLSGDQPATLIPMFLKNNYPYAAEGASINLVYNFRNADKVTAVTATHYDFVAGEWVANKNYVYSSPYERMEAGWMFNPSMTIDILPVTGDANGLKYYQGVVDYLKAEGIDEGYFRGYDNSENYCGCSSYYNNVSWGYKYVVEAWMKAGEDFTPYNIGGGIENIRALHTELESRLTKTFGDALSTIHPDAMPVEGMDVLYKFNIFIFIGRYDQDKPSHQLVYKVVGKGQFEFVEIKCLDSTYDYMSEENLQLVCDTYGSYADYTVE